MGDLLGGTDRIDADASAWGDSFIVNLGLPPSSSEPSSFGSASPTPAALTNWHVDGDFFVHFLDSPEQALLVIPLFSDIRPSGGATYIAPEGIRHVAQYLAAHPEGVVPARLSFVPSTSAPLTSAPLDAAFVERAKSAQGTGRTPPQRSAASGSSSSPARRATSCSCTRS